MVISLASRVSECVAPVAHHPCASIRHRLLISFILVRERAKHVFELLSDDSRLRDEREKAQKNTGKFDTAISSDSYGGGGGGGGYGGYGGGGGGGRGGEYPGARSYGNRESGSTYTGGGNPRSANDRFGDEDYAPRRAAPSNPSRAPPYGVLESDVASFSCFVQYAPQ